MPGPAQSSTRSPGSTSVATAEADETTSPPAVDADPLQRLLVVAQGSGAVVGHEEHRTGRAQSRHRVGRTGDRLLGEPHHAVQIEGPRHEPGRLPAGPPPPTRAPWPGPAIRSSLSAVRATPRAMPAFAPFRGVRFDPERTVAADVTAPPYDVIDEEQRAALIERCADNVVRVDLPSGEDGRDPYEVAPALLAAWRADGTLVRDQSASYYVYRLDFVDDTGVERSTTGVFGALTLERPGEGGILPHEQTTPKAKSDRLRMLQVCEANLSAVWGLVPAPGLTTLLTVDQPALGDFVDEDGVRHRFWVVDDPETVRSISATVSAAPMVIADGHHRFETSLAYRDERRETDGAGPWDAALFWAVELSEEQLCVRPIHRLLSGLPDDLDLVAALAPSFEATSLGPPGDLDDGVVDPSGRRGRTRPGPPRRGPVAAAATRGVRRAARPRHGAARRRPRRPARPTTSPSSTASATWCDGCRRATPRRACCSGRRA